MTEVCKKAACRIQVCLKENEFQEEKCQDVIDKLIKCCREKPQAKYDIRCSGFTNHMKVVEPSSTTTKDKPT